MVRSSSTDIAADPRAISRVRTLGYDLLFTMSDNTHASAADGRQRTRIDFSRTNTKFDVWLAQP
jgi:hypothetical protein